MNKYQEALDRIRHWQDIQVNKLENNNLVFLGETEEFKLLEELVNKATPKKPIGRHTDYKCPVCGRRVRSGLGSSSRQRDYVCQRCFQVLDW